MFGRDDLKELRQAALREGCDAGTFRSWQKKYERLARQYTSVWEKYTYAVESAQRVLQIVGKLEQMIIQGQREREALRQSAELFKELKKHQNEFDHPFLISAEDREFHTTYASVLKLGTKALEQPEQRLILQSEIENLLALLKENLERSAPQPVALAFFYQEHDERELAELPPEERRTRIVDICQREFIDPLARMLHIPAADAQHMMEGLLGNAAE